MATLSAATLLKTRVYLISSATIEGVLYGFAFALYAFCARSLYLQLKDQDRRRKHLFTLLYMSLLMVLALSEVAVDAQGRQTSYVDHGSYPNGGGLGYSLYFFSNSPIATAGCITTTLYTVMVPGIQIWRLWIIWSASPYSIFIMILPVLALLMYTGLQVTNILFVWRSSSNVHIGAFMNYGSSTIPLCISLSVTCLIIGKILMVRRKNKGLMGRINMADPYTSVISMLVESFSLEFIWLVAQLTLTLIGSPATTVLVSLFANTLPFIQLLSYLLVVHRVTTGHEWKRDTEEKLTMSLQWNRDGTQTTQVSTQASVLITDEEV